jgi:methionyl-tRNA formyltransferase
VERSTEIEIEYTDTKGQRKRGKLSGFYARIIQHEYDHLNSTFYIQRIQKPKHLYKFDPINIVFFGSSEFSATVLLSLIGQTFVGDYTIPLVITSPDKPTGRGQKVQPSTVKRLTQQFNIETIEPEKLARRNGDIFELTNKDVYDKIKKLKPDVLVLASYGKILPKEILDLPKYAPVNVHPSLLPKYRGPSPIQSPLLNGDKVTGVTIMKMNEKMDEGDIYVKSRYEIKEGETAESLSKALADISKDLLHHTIHYLAIKKIKTRPQDHSKATYTKIIHREDGKIDWQKPPKNLERLIRAYYSWPGVWTQYDGKILKLLPEHKVQLEGKNPVSLKDFKSGHKDFNLIW